MHDKEIYEILKDLGVPTHLKGYKCTVLAVSDMLEHPEHMDKLVQEVYGSVAKTIGGGATPARVERAIRHAISYVFLNTESAVLERYFGHMIRYKDGKVTNKCFISNIAECIRMKEV